MARAKHVLFKNGSWVVQVNGHAKSALIFPTKLQAIKAAVRPPTAPVLIHSKHGHILRWVGGGEKRDMEILDAVHAIGSGEKPRRRRVRSVAA